MRVGTIAICLAIVGSVTSISVVRAGGADGAVHLSVNVLLAVLGVVLLFVASRRRRVHRGVQGSSPRE